MHAGNLSQIALPNMWLLVLTLVQPEVYLIFWSFQSWLLINGWFFQKVKTSYSQGSLIGFAVRLKILILKIRSLCFDSNSSFKIWKELLKNYLNAVKKLFLYFWYSKLIIEAINVAKALTNIKFQDLPIVIQAWEILVFQNSKPWVEKPDKKDFDTPVGYYDIAKLYELSF